MQWWDIVNWTPRNKLQWNVNQNSYIFIQENTFKNVVWKIAAILSQPQCVNMAQFSCGQYIVISSSFEEITVNTSSAFSAFTSQTHVGDVQIIIVNIKIHKLIQDFFLPYIYIYINCFWKYLIKWGYDYKLLSSQITTTNIFQCFFLLMTMSRFMDENV